MSFLRQMMALALVAAPLGASLSACSTTANVTEVFTSLDEDGARRRNLFFTDSKNIFCIARTGVGRPGVTAEAFIRQSQAYDLTSNRFVPVNRVAAYSEMVLSPSNGEQRISLQLRPLDEKGEPDQELPFFVGSFECEIRLDGVIEGRTQFNIDYPPCPPAIIVPGTQCIGFYREGDQCPAAGESGDPKPTCSCTEAQGWQC